MLRQLIETVVSGIGDGRSRDDDTAPSDDRPNTRLYRCGDCEETFISTAMDDCPRCGTPVEPVPTAADLGFGPASTSR